MTKLNNIKLLNDSTIYYLKNSGKDCNKNEQIKQFLQDDACFFKITQQNAYKILEDIGVSKESIASLYLELISKQEYYYLINSGKLKEEDSRIIYNDYNPTTLFNNSNKT